MKRSHIMCDLFMYLKPLSLYKVIVHCIATQNLLLHHQYAQWLHLNAT